MTTIDGSTSYLTARKSISYNRICGGPFFTVKPPVNRDPVTIHPAVPGARFRLECLQMGYASFAEALTGKQADFDLRLIQPASMGGRVVACEAIPDPVARRRRRSVISGNGC